MSGQQQPEPTESDLPITAERLLNVYAKALRRYLVAERTLVDATEPVALKVVLEHHAAFEHFQTIRGALAASVRHSAALQETEASSA